jgi:hypothetical protein
MPEELIVPAAALPPVTPFTCQVTEVFDDPVTFALNDFVVPARTIAIAGETVTVTLCPEGGVLGLEGDELFVAPVHPVSAKTANRDTKNAECRKTKVINIFISKRIESAALMRRIVRIERCLDVSRGTTVRKDKIRHGTPEQEGEAANKLASRSGKRAGGALAVLASRFFL